MSMSVHRHTECTLRSSQGQQLRAAVGARDVACDFSRGVWGGLHVAEWESWGRKGGGWEVAQSKEMKWNKKTCFSPEKERLRLHSNPTARWDVYGVLCMWVTPCWCVSSCVKLYMFICLMCAYTWACRREYVWSSWWDHSSVVYIEEKAKWRIKSPFEFSGGGPGESKHGLTHAHTYKAKTAGNKQTPLWICMSEVMCSCILEFDVVWCLSLSRNQTTQISAILVEGDRWDHLARSS